jgi:hypothetical protein
MWHEGKRCNYIPILMRKTWSKGTTGKTWTVPMIWGEGGQITGAWRSGRGPRAQLCHICFCISRWYHYLPIVQMNPFRQSPIHSAIDSLPFQFSVKILSWSALAGVKRKNIIHRGPWLEPPVDGPGLSNEWEDNNKMCIQQKKARGHGMSLSVLRQELEARCCAHCCNALGSTEGKLYRETLLDVFQGTTMTCKDIPGTQFRKRSVVNFSFSAPPPPWQIKSHSTNWTEVGQTGHGSRRKNPCLWC